MRVALAEATAQKRLLALEKRLGGGARKLVDKDEQYIRQRVMSAIDFMRNKNRKPIPRAVPTKVNCFESKLMMRLPYGQETDPADPRRGLAGVQQFMCAARQAAFVEHKQISAPVTCSCTVTGENPAISGLWPLSEGAVNEAMTSGTLEVDNNNYRNIVGLWTYDDEVESQGRVASIARDKNGDVFFGIPFELAATAQSVFITIENSTPMAQGTQLSVQLLSTTNVITVNSNAIAAASATATFQADFNTAQSDLGGRYACATFENPIGVRFRMAGAGTGTIRPTSIRLSITQAVNAGSSTLMRWQYVTAPVQSDVQTLYKKVSVVGGGIYATYVGSDLLNGGLSAYAMYRGGAAPGLEGLNGVDSIGESLEGYSDALKMGHYCPLQPSTEEDIEFYDRRSVTHALTLSTQVMFWNVADLTQKTVLRVYFFLLCEGTSTSPLIKLEEAPPIPAGTARYITLCNRFPARVENPLHWGDIKAFGQRVFRGAQHVVEFYNKHSSWINPLLGAIAAALV